MDGAVVALVPAHNEADRIQGTLRSLATQTRPPDRVLVIADNCTDATDARAAACGAEVRTTRGNADKKAGALNQVLAELLPGLPESAQVLIVDADSVLAPGFVEVACARLGADPEIGAIGGVFVGERGGGFLGALQRNEYARYQRQIARRGGDALVLTGTATLHRVSVLRRLAGARGGVYDATALTEDNEITLAIKTLGLRCVSPPECLVETELMPSWRDLWNQRLRWQRGALENLRGYGWTPVTAPYVLQQAGMFLGLVAMWLYLVFTVHLAVAGELGLHPWWTLIGLVFVVERIVTVWHAGPKARWYAAAFFPEWGYDLFLQLVMLRATLDVLLGRPAQWHHVASDRPT